MTALSLSGLRTGVMVVCLALTGCTPAPAPYREAMFDEPSQTPTSAEPFWHDSHGQVRLTPVAEWDSLTRVWSVVNYDDEDNLQDQLAPMDAVLAWNEAGRPEVYEQLDRRHKGRWYYYDHPEENDGLPSIREIGHTSSNVHLIPADAVVAHELARLDDGMVVALTGWLVRADRRLDDGAWWWTSSTRRTDTGDGACELLYVQQVRVFDGSSPLPVGS